MPGADAGQARAQRFATASVQLEPTGVETERERVIGGARFRATRSGVDLQVEFAGGCNGVFAAEPFPVVILDTADCAQAASAEPWARGRDIVGARCVGAAGPGRLSFVRGRQHEHAWTIGGAARSDVIGRALVVGEPGTGRPLACGVIRRAEDFVSTPLPPADAPPRVEVRAHIAGSCVLKAAGTPFTPGCPEPNAIASCAAEHCDLGGCLEHCSDYADCLDRIGDTCASAADCSAGPECLHCQSQIFSCTLGFCGAALSCPIEVTPDGPCSQLLACCALQGEHAGSCSEAVRLFAVFGGDASCVGGMNDWDTLAHLPVPCKFVE